MPKPISTFCNASRSHLAVTRTPYVWISDDTLSETFTAFARKHKRYGSNVPGPLEARRRGTKRRATHLAHQAAPNYGPESFGIFDTRSQDGWWNKTESPGETTTNSWLWPLTFPLIAREPPSPPIPSKSEDVLATSLLTYEKAEIASIEKEIYTHLQGVCTHSEAMDILSYLRIDLRRDPHLAEVVLRCMLAQSWKHGEIAEFLLDPWTNPPGSTNHIYILEHAEKHADLMLWLFEENIFTDAARLGLIDVLEIQRMLRIIPWLHFPENLENTTWASFCSQLLAAMGESKVLTVRDLDKSFLIEWLGNITSYSFCPAVPGLLWKMYRSVGLGAGDALEQVVHSSISMVERSTICKLNSLVDFLRSQPYSCVGPILFSLTQRLINEAGLEKPDWLLTSSLDQRVDRLFRQDLLRQVGGNLGLGSLTSEEKVPVRLVFHGNLREKSKIVDAESPDASMPRMVQYRISHVSKLELWYAVLGNLGSTAEFQFEMDNSTLKNFVQTQVEGPEVNQRLIIATWVAMALSIRDDSFIKLSGVSQAIALELRRSFLTATAAREDVLVNLLENLQLLPLPAKNKLLRRIHELSGRLINAEQNYWDMIRILHDLNDARILEISSRNSYESMKLHFPVKLTQMCEGFNEDMALFEKSCIGVFRHAKGSINIVFRVLDHNRALQKFLHRAGFMMHSTHRRWHRPLRAQSETLGGRSPLQLLDMIERFAHEIARSEQLSSRNAFRKVYWLKRYLVRLRIPIRSAIWKALWYARVTRQDEEGKGACYYTVKWLYDKITKTDGQAEADRLLRISSVNDLMKKPDEIHMMKTPIRENIMKRADGLVSTGAEKTEVTGVLPFSTTGLTAFVDAPGEAKDIRKHYRKGQQISVQFAESAQDGQSIETANILSSGSEQGSLLQDQRIGFLGGTKTNAFKRLRKNGASDRRKALRALRFSKPPNPTP